jgi:tetratricopeptide (TPR) repeat protein
VSTVATGRSARETAAASSPGTIAKFFSGRRGRFVVAWAVALTLGACSFRLADEAYRRVPRPQSLEELSYYPSGRFLKPAALGHEATSADLAWLRAVQYYGEHRNSDNRFQRMGHVFEILTSLAPEFVPSYVFGAFALAQEGQDFPAAERLMLKGIENNPTSAELAFQLGFLYYVKPGGRDLRRAAEYFQQASRLPNAPPQAARFAAFSRQSAGDLTLAYELWQDVSLDSPNSYLRDMARKEMGRIQQAIQTGRHEEVRPHLTVPRVLLKSGS